MKRLFFFFSICLLTTGDIWAIENLHSDGGNKFIEESLSFQESAPPRAYFGGDSTRYISFGTLANYAYIITEGALTICPGDTITLSAGGGTAASTYLWSTGETTPSIRVFSSGSYGLTITTFKGKGKCRKQVAVAAPVTVSVNTLITDLDTNGTVNVMDYTIFLGAFNSLCQGCPQDFISDGFVDIRDYLRWVSDINKSCNN